MQGLGSEHELGAQLYMRSELHSRASAVDKRTDCTDYSVVLETLVGHMDIALGCTGRAFARKAAASARKAASASKAASAFGRNDAAA